MPKIACSSCGKQLQGDYPICPYCKTPRTTQVPYEPREVATTPPAKPQKPKKKERHTARTLLVVLAILVGAIAAFGSSNNDKSSNKETDKPVASESNKGSEVISSPKIETDFDTSEYIKMNDEILFEYGNYMNGERVVTAITISAAENGYLKAHTDNNDSFFYSINCEFQDEDYPKQFSEGDAVTIAGQIANKKLPIGDTVVLNDCHVIGYGEIADELKAEMEKQRAKGEEFKLAYEKAISDIEEAEKNEYIGQCVTVKYSDVERNPDNFQGEKIKITGRVIQVGEGLFDSVTLRVDCNGNVWYVTYTREDGESRILEGDNITCYGECDGVRSYTSVLGSQVTIPSLKMKYYS